MKTSNVNGKSVVVNGNLAFLSFEKLENLRKIKREASARCRARQKAISKGELLTPELAVRSKNSKALKVENFKMQVNDKVVRLNRNGGEKVAMVVKTGDNVIRKSFKNINEAVKAFEAEITA